MAEEIRENSNFIHDFIDKDLEDGVYSRYRPACPRSPTATCTLATPRPFASILGVKEKYKGVCNLRLDDTNPTRETPSM